MGPLLSELKRGPMRGGELVHQVRQSVTAGVIDRAPLNAVELDSQQPKNSAGHHRPQPSSPFDFPRSPSQTIIGTCPLIFTRFLFKRWHRLSLLFGQPIFVRSNDVFIFWIGGNVCPFVRVFLVIIEFFTAIRVSNIAPPVTAHCVVALAVSH